MQPGPNLIKASSLSLFACKMLKYEQICKNHASPNPSTFGIMTFFFTNGFTLKVVVHNISENNWKHMYLCSYLCKTNNKTNTTVGTKQTGDQVICNCFDVEKKLHYNIMWCFVCSVPDA